MMTLTHLAIQSPFHLSESPFLSLSLISAVFLTHPRICPCTFGPRLGYSTKPLRTWQDWGNSASWRLCRIYQPSPHDKADAGSCTVTVPSLFSFTVTLGRKHWLLNWTSGLQMRVLQLINCMAINNLCFLSELSFLLHKMGSIIHLGTIKGIKCKVPGIVPDP